MEINARNQAAREKMIELAEAKERKKNDLMESDSKWKNTLPKQQQVVSKEQINKIIEQEAFKKKPQPSKNIVDYTPTKEPLQITTKKLESPNTRLDYTEIPI